MPATDPRDGPSGLSGYPAVGAAGHGIARAPRASGSQVTFLRALPSGDVLVTVPSGRPCRGCGRLALLLVMRRNAETLGNELFCVECAA